MQPIDGRLLGAPIAPHQPSPLRVVCGRARWPLDYDPVVIELDRGPQILTQRVRVLPLGPADADPRPRHAVDDVVAELPRQ